MITYENVKQLKYLLQNKPYPSYSGILKSLTSAHLISQESALLQSLHELVNSIEAYQETNRPMMITLDHEPVSVSLVVPAIIELIKLRENGGEVYHHAARRFSFYLSPKKTEELAFLFNMDLLSHEHCAAALKRSDTSPLTALLVLSAKENSFSKEHIETMLNHPYPKALLIEFIRCKEKDQYSSSRYIELLSMPVTHCEAHFSNFLHSVSLLKKQNRLHSAYEHKLRYHPSPLSLATIMSFVDLNYTNLHLLASIPQSTEEKEKFDKDLHFLPIYVGFCLSLLSKSELQSTERRNNFINETIGSFFDKKSYLPLYSVFTIPLEGTRTPESDRQFAELLPRPI